MHARLRTMLEGIHEELNADAPGAAAIATDLASALFVMLRTHLDVAGTSPGVVRLLGQRGTMRALLAMVRYPAHDWTLEELAVQAGMSRATLVRAFRAAAGVAPLAFLTDLRMSLARQRLQRGHASIGEIAADVGYQSEAEFSRAAAALWCATRRAPSRSWGTIALGPQAVATRQSVHRRPRTCLAS